LAGTHFGSHDFSIIIFREFGGTARHFISIIQAKKAVVACGSAVPGRPSPSIPPRRLGLPPVPHCQGLRNCRQCRPITSWARDSSVIPQIAARIGHREGVACEALGAEKIETCTFKNMDADLCSDLGELIEAEASLPSIGTLDEIVLPARGLGRRNCKDWIQNNIARTRSSWSKAEPAVALPPSVRRDKPVCARQSRRSHFPDWLPT
jgi:hypothetical protein